MYWVGIMFGFFLVGFVASHWPKLFLNVMTPIGIVTLFIVLIMYAKEVNDSLKNRKKQ